MENYVGDTQNSKLSNKWELALNMNAIVVSPELT